MQSSLKYFFDDWPSMEAYLSGKEVFLFLDYDGTLAPIADTPDQAVMQSAMRKALLDLSRKSRCHIYVVSGRMLTDLTNMVKIPDIVYIGNHGYEAQGFELRFNDRHLPARYIEHIATIKELLSAALSHLKGVWVEDKGIIVAVHYRLASLKDTALARQIFIKVCQPFLENHLIQMMEGKKVLEVRPPFNWNKGEAVKAVLLKMQNEFGEGHCVSIIIGDDVTDEDIFRLMKNESVTVKVGKTEKSSADYYINTQDEVLGILERILSLKGAAS